MSAENPTATRMTLYRDAGSRFGGFVRSAWRRRWVKLLAILVASPFVLYFLLLLIFARGLPSAESLLTYQPPLPSTVRDIDGMPVQTFARERRVQLSYNEFPPKLIDAFLSAEDKSFFSHHGIDYGGLAEAVVDYVRKAGTGERARGGSTITQQVAKNLLVGNQYSVTRKIKEAILARRIENVLTKQQILELYLNQIFLGRNAYGVEAAAHAYFDKSVSQLSLPEAAFLAILPKGPSNYDPNVHADRALERRNWVLGEMAKNGFITAAQASEAQAAPLGTVAGARESVRNVGGYFMEEVRRQLIARYGEGTEKGPDGVYTGGLWIRSSYDPKKQQAAEQALRDGMVRYDNPHGWNDPGKTIDIGKNWALELANLPFGTGYSDWRAAVVLSREGASATIGFADGSRGTLPASLAAMPKRGVGGTAFSFLEPGKVIVVKREGAAWALKSIPVVRGAMVVEEVASGRILAMQGGWDIRGDDFNRATQAYRQPGSTFKPVVYSAALDNGMTPATIIIDGPFCVWQGAGLGNKCFRNFSGQNAGPQTMRWAVEQSRNLMTVRTANEIGMDKVTKRAHDLGVGDFPNYLSIALGAGETTPIRMANAFSILANSGRAVKPSLVDYVEDRNGKIIYRADTRPCEGCNAPDWNGKPMPRPPLRTKQIVDPLTAYQMVHIMEGVVLRGTAQTLRELGRPMFGKTGTTTGPTNVWFVGGMPQVLAATYLGFDQPRPMGGYAQGGTIVAPIFKQFAKAALMDLPVVPFRQPPGIRMVRIDRRSGQQVYGEWPSDDPKSAVIWEAFKPQTEPRRAARHEELASSAAAPKAAKKAAAQQTQQSRDTDFLQNQGGIY